MAAMGMRYLVLAMAHAVPAQADVENKSSLPVYVKDGRSDLVIAVRPGDTYRGEQDGLAVAGVRRGEVFKTVDGINAHVDRDGNVFTSGGSFFERIGQFLIGGWKGADFVVEHPDWKPLFDRSKHSLR